MKVRKNVQISPEKYVFDLAEKQCTQIEIARLLGISVDTLVRRYADEFAKGKESGKVALRTLLFQKASSGNVVALIFALKNYCGMSDRVQQEISGPNGAPLQLESTRTDLEAKLDKLIAKREKKDGAATE